MRYPVFRNDIERSGTVSSVREERRVMVRIRRIGAVILVAGALMQPARSDAELTESKQQTIRELLTIVGVVGMAEQMRDQQSIVELMRVRPSYYQMMEFAVSEQTDLSEEDRQLLLARLGDFDAFAARFRVLFAERVNFSQIIETVYPPLYDKYFSEEELREMLVFYSTPVGRKNIEVMPSLMQEAGGGVEAAVQPLAVGLIQEIVSEERAKLAD
jgi:hypothetical protein